MFRGHTAEIVCLTFNPSSTLVATGSMDTTARLWGVEDGKEKATLAVGSWCLYSRESGKSVIPLVCVGTLV